MCSFDDQAKTVTAWLGSSDSFALFTRCCTFDAHWFRSLQNSPNGKILETDVVIAKNYLSKEEVESLELIVSAFLDLAENRVKRHIPMTMEDWSTRIDKFLLADDLDVLKDAGKISHEIACDKALTEFEKYRVKQDKLYKSDFDLLLEEVKDNGSGNND